MSPKSKTRWLFLALTVLMSLVSFSAMAQRSDGNIGGVAVAGDQVSAVSLGTGLKREAVADEDGKYRFRSLPTGEYQVTIVRGGATVANVKLFVRPGTTSRVPDQTSDRTTQTASQAAPAN